MHMQLQSSFICMYMHIWQCDTLSQVCTYIKIIIIWISTSHFIIESLSVDSHLLALVRTCFLYLWFLHTRDQTSLLFRRSIGSYWSAEVRVHMYVHVYVLYVVHTVGSYICIYSMFMRTYIIAKVPVVLIEL